MKLLCSHVSKQQNLSYKINWPRHPCFDFSPVQPHYTGVVVVMTSPSGNCLYEGTKMSQRDEEFHQRRDLSLPRDSWQPFYWLGHHSRGAVIAYSWHIVDHCQTIDVDDVDKLSRCSRFSRHCSGFYRSKDPTNSIIVLKEVYYAGINSQPPRKYSPDSLLELLLQIHVPVLSRHLYGTVAAAKDVMCVFTYLVAVHSRECDRCVCVVSVMSSSHIVTLHL